MNAIEILPKSEIQNAVTSLNAWWSPLIAAFAVALSKLNLMKSCTMLMVFDTIENRWFNFTDLLLLLKLNGKLSRLFWRWIASDGFQFSYFKILEKLEDYYIGMMKKNTVIHLKLCIVFSRFGIASLEKC